MENFRYVKEMMNSFSDVFRRPILLLPFVYLFVLSTIFLLIIPQMPSSEQAVMAPTIDYNLILTILGLNLIQVLIAILFNGMGLGSFRRHVESEELTAGKQANDGFRMYWKLLLLRIYQVLLVVVPLIMVLIIVGAMGDKTTALIVGGILLLLFIVYIIMVAIYFMFSNVIIAYEGKSAGQALSESYKYFKKNSAHTFFTFLVLAGFLLILIVIALIISLSSMLLSFDVNLSIWSSIIIGLISIPISAAMMLFIFKAFKAGDFTPEIKEEKIVKVQDIKTTKEFDSKNNKAAQVASAQSTRVVKKTSKVKTTAGKKSKK